MTMITLEVKEAKSFLSKVVGLLSAKKPYSLLLRTRWGLHTFGMRFPIDVIVLDSKNMIVGLHKNLKPNRMYFWNPIHKVVIELPVGIIKEKKMEKGKQIDLLIR